jgi:hypothetical protein
MELTSLESFYMLNLSPSTLDYIPIILIMWVEILKMCYYLLS